ncbi:hypothetical protein MUP38_00880, partial [Candidatus Bathyarchaeota archaeon]|nr:hypothetical protein [Candidatus Bathyarchaeota archaeon]
WSSLKTKRSLILRQTQQEIVQKAIRKHQTGLFEGETQFVNYQNLFAMQLNLKQSISRCALSAF